VKKLVSLALVFSIFLSSPSIFAFGSDNFNKNLNRIATLAVAAALTGLTVGTLAGAKVAAKEIKKLQSPEKEFAAKTLVGFTGITASIASLIFSFRNIGAIIESEIKYEIKSDSIINEFSLAFYTVNIFASLYALKCIALGQVFSDKNVKLNINI
jgi:hypothetical protein